MNGWRYASIKGRTDKSRSATVLCGPSGATTGFPQQWQHARTCRVSDTPPCSGALQVWVGLVGARPPPESQAREMGRHRGRPDANVSEQTTLREAHYDVRGDHQVIKHAHVDQLQRSLQRLRQVLVGTAGLRRTRRMVVRLMWPKSLCAIPWLRARLPSSRRHCGPHKQVGALASPSTLSMLTDGFLDRKTTARPSRLRSLMQGPKTGSAESSTAVVRHGLP